jgi:hypothetical protein
MITYYSLINDGQLNYNLLFCEKNLVSGENSPGVVRLIIRISDQLPNWLTSETTRKPAREERPWSQLFKGLIFPKTRRLMVRQVSPLSPTCTTTRLSCNKYSNSAGNSGSSWNWFFPFSTLCRARPPFPLWFWKPTRSFPSILYDALFSSAWKNVSTLGSVQTIKHFP